MYIDTPKTLFLSLSLWTISITSTLMFWYMAVIIDILQRENNRILGGSVIIIYAAYFGLKVIYMRLPYHRQTTLCVNG